MNKGTLRSARNLVDAGLIPPERAAAVAEVAARYAVAVTPAMAALIDPADRDDPIARQFIPDPAELMRTDNERDDPIGDDAHAVAPGLIHRYPDRVLLKLTSVCAVYCRFCFRRETVGHGSMLSPVEVAAALAYVRAHPAVWEVIVSGGDPLVVAPRRLKPLVAALAEIDHVGVVRFHTRVPVVAPERVTSDLIAALKASGKATWVAVHANHPRELTEAARASLRRLAGAGIALASQTVLLKGVNDDADTLAALMRAFVEAGVKPYYLHHGDLAPGTARFRTTLGEGQALDEGPARPSVGPLPADLRARHSGRPRQGAGRAGLRRSQERRLLRRGLQRCQPPLSARGCDRVSAAAWRVC